MAAAGTWPASLPQQQFLDTRDQLQESRLRTRMDTGPPKMRRRNTASIREIVTAMVFDNEQRDTFDTFFRTVLKEGSLSFNWKDPINDAVVEYRFVNIPSFRLIKRDGLDRWWRTSLTLEILP